MKPVRIVEVEDETYFLIHNAILDDLQLLGEDLFSCYWGLDAKDNNVLSVFSEYRVKVISYYFDVEKAKRAARLLTDLYAELTTDVQPEPTYGSLKEIGF